MKFTFNRKARSTASAAVRAFEKGSYVTAVFGSFGADPKVTALASVVMFVFCKIMETIIAGIEDTVEGKANRRKKVVSAETTDSG